MGKTLDIEKFSNSVKSKRGKLKLGLRVLANDIGISASTLSRIEQGKLPDIDTYIKLCDWLEVPTEYFTVTVDRTDDIKSEVIAHLRADKNLPSETAEALIQMINIAYASTTKQTQI